MKLGYEAYTIVHPFCTCIEVVNYPIKNLVLNMGCTKKEWANTDKNTVGFWKIKNLKL